MRGREWVGVAWINNKVGKEKGHHVVFKHTGVEGAGALLCSFPVAPLLLLPGDGVAGTLGLLNENKKS